MLRLCGCGIAGDDADYLIATLTDHGTPAALEAAAAIRWGVTLDVETPELEPELRREILSALDGRTPIGLVPFRNTLRDVRR